MPLSSGRSRMVWCPSLCARKKLVPSTLRIYPDVSHLWRSLSRLLSTCSIISIYSGMSRTQYIDWSLRGWMSRTQSIHRSFRWVDVKDTLHPQESPMGGCQGHTTSRGVSDGWMSRTHYIHRSLREGCQGHTTSTRVSRVDVKDQYISTSTGVSEGGCRTQTHASRGFQFHFSYVSLHLQPVADIDGEVKIFF